MKPTFELVMTMLATWFVVCVVPLFVAIWGGEFWLWAALWVFIGGAAIATVWTLLAMWSWAWRAQSRYNSRGR